MRIRVGLVDDHPAVIHGVAAMLALQEDITVTARAATVRELLDQESRFEVVLLDLLLRDGSTPEENIRALEPTGAHVVIYSSGEIPELVREASRAGALGMIRKSTGAPETIHAIRAAARGEVAASADWAAALDMDAHFVGTVLSTREAEVLALYASGETAERVGAALYISRDTVIDHVRRIRAKYAAHGRPAQTKIDLHRRAVEDGIIGGRA